MKSYHFSFGNSNDGPIGYCAIVEAESPEAAVALLAEHVRSTLRDGLSADSPDDPEEIAYIEVYINPDAITVGDIDMVNGEDVDNEC